jgi:hypothetical protein
MVIKVNQNRMRGINMVYHIYQVLREPAILLVGFMPFYLIMRIKYGLQVPVQKRLELMMLLYGIPQAASIRQKQ